MIHAYLFYFASYGCFGLIKRVLYRWPQKTSFFERWQKNKNGKQEAAGEKGCRNVGNEIQLGS